MNPHRFCAVTSYCLCPTARIWPLKEMNEYGPLK